MELWIRSQDKESLIKVEKIELIYDYLCSEDIQLIHIETDKGRIGSYLTLERALEVLDEIQNILNPKVLVNTYKVESAQLCDGTQFIKPVLDDIQVQNVTSYVYEIPKD